MKGLIIKPSYLFEGNGAPGGIRIPSLLIRSQMLYPVELRAQSLKKTRKLAKKRQESKNFVPSCFAAGF